MISDLGLLNYTVAKSIQNSEDGSSRFILFCNKFALEQRYSVTLETKKFVSV